ncbi:MAG: WavE lipopolysaccharide synthesis family protein [Rhodospirillales bacterium]|jgi:hypothetical protein|nr:hypothetical protein [Rhodospirillaceae bacterium]MDP6644322.1 WavE lipopolysaccharide synthesis family protein [Rhodospirillales bacterium]MDP6843549.1 WavE lipopolysaccharide synthesis family protein [Rhodospirillales bacterium]|tara:strand:- start:78 stop:1169 length:1092 start_codon:yes stop_codon:yes gene_type:complete
MMPNTPVSIIFSGLLRDKDLFLRSLDAFRGMSGVEEIVLSTWDKEAQENLEFLTKLGSQYDLILAAVPEPQSWSGNMLSQMMSLQVGLRRVPEGHRVLKTRTDVFIEPDAFAHVTGQDGKLRFPQNFARARHIFEQRVWVWGMEATSPFYIHDLFFFGHKRDVAKLVNMDIRYDVMYQMSKERIHIRRFLHPFIYEFPIFERFLHIENVLGATHEFPNEYRYSVLRQLLQNDTYVRILALYYKIASLYFSNDWGGGRVFEWRDQPEQVAFSAGMSISDILMGQPRLKAIMPVGDDYFRRVAGGKYRECDIGRRFDDARAYLEGLTDIREACLEADFDAFMEFAIAAGQTALGEVKDKFNPGET